MTMTVPRLIAGAAALVLLSSIPARAADAAPAAAQPGDLWEVTTQMSMEGMPMAMPVQKQKVCAPKEWTEPPGGADEARKCQNSDFKKDGPKATWKVTCAGPPPMSGEGEIIRDGADAYTGTIKFTSADGNITIKLGGHKLGGCDKPVK
jgi:uncharacterized protein DUF3617